MMSHLGPMMNLGQIRKNLKWTQRPVTFYSGNLKTLLTVKERLRDTSMHTERLIR